MKNHHLQTEACLFQKKIPDPKTDQKKCPKKCKKSRSNFQLWSKLVHSHNKNHQHLQKDANAKFFRQYLDIDGYIDDLTRKVNAEVLS